MGHRRAARGPLLLVLAALTLGATAMAVWPTVASAAGPFIVDTTADTVDAAPGNGTCADASNQCSLRAAVQEANAIAGADTIVLPTATYTLTRAGRGEDLAVTGDLDINGTLSLSAAGNPVIDGGGLDRILDVRTGGILYLLGVRLTGGDPGANTGGGALRAAPSTVTTLASARIDASTAGGGGAIWADGPLTMANTQLDHNTGTLFGGAIVATKSLALTNTTIDNNTAGSGGGVFAVGSGAVTVSGTTFEANTATKYGGGLLTTRGATISSSTIQGNTGANAAGLYASTAGALTLTASTVSDNQAIAGGGFGGGVLAEVPATISTTRISANHADIGGGLVSAASLTIDASTIDGNDADLAGGGIIAAGSPFTVANSTISGNSTAGPGGGVAHASSATFDSVTITDNSASLAAGLYALGPGEQGSAGGTTHLRNTIIADQAAGADCGGTGTIISDGHNLSTSAAAACGLTGPGDLTAQASADLDPLADNGGGLPTHLPSAASAAIGNGDTALAIDQRGYARPVAGADDIGAVEAIRSLSLIVDDPGDTLDALPGDGLCLDANGDCTLRAAIGEANAWTNDYDGPDDITIAPSISLVVLSRGGPADDTNLTGDLDITGDLEIDGGGAVVDANQLDRVVEVHAGSTALLGIELTGGTPPLSEHGGGVRSHPDTEVILVETLITGNATNSGGGGGGAFAEGDLTVSDSTISANDAGTAGGGGINGGGAHISIVDSEISNNLATGAGGGVALSTAGANDDDGTLEIVDSVVSGNTGDGGGGIFVVGSHSNVVNVLRTAVVANHGGSGGNGGIAAAGSTLDLENSTVAGNSASSGVGGLTVDAAATIRHATIAYNSGTQLRADGAGLEGSAIVSTVLPLCSGTPPVSQGYNLATNASCALTHGTDRFDNPLLGAAQDNGGATITALPFDDSPLIDAIPPGSAGCGTMLTVDQRGEARPAGAACDIGATEGTAGPAPGLDLVVNTSTDAVDINVGDGTCLTAGGQCSLRAAVQEANALAGIGTVPDRITIGSDIDPVLSIAGSEDLALSGDLDLNGFTEVHGHGATVTGPGNDRVFDLHGSVIGLDDLTVTGGSSSTGGGVRNAATLYLRNSSVVSNSGNSGAGVFSTGSLLVTGSLIAQNTGTIGVGIYTSGTVSVEASTVTGNSGSTGVAIYVIGTPPTASVSMRNSTVSNNSASVSVLQASAGGWSVEWTTIHANTAPKVLGGSAALTSLRASTINNAYGPACGFTTPPPSGGYVVSDGTCVAAGDLTNLTANPALTPLSTNGGTTPSHLPHADGPVVDAVPPGILGCGTSMTTDQRGAARPAGAACDIGSVEGEGPAIDPLDLLVDTVDDGVDADTGDGLCLTAAGNCSVRAAIQQTNTWPTADRITIAPGIDPLLSLAGTTDTSGDLDLRDIVDIDGNGATLTADDLDRGIEVVAGVATINDLTITDGTASTGGGIRNGSQVTLVDVAISESRTSGSGTGGGLVNNGIATLTRVRVTENDAGGDGGGIYNTGSLAVTASTIDKNIAGGSGGGVAHNAGTASIHNSTLSQNHAPSGGQLRFTADLTLTASTVVAPPLTSGIARTNGTITMRGVVIESAFGAACSGTSPVQSLGWNVGSDTTCGLGTATDLVAIALLGPLGDSGGATPTHVPFDGSPLVDAIPAGQGGCGSTLVVDQRDQPRPVGSGCDVGAVEGSTAAPDPLSLVVDTPVDEPDVDLLESSCTTASGDCSLRAAVQQANAWPTADTITIEAGVDPILSVAGRNEDLAETGDIDIYGALTVNGAGAEVDGDEIDRVLHVRGGSTTINDIPIRNGSASSTTEGGGVFNQAELHLVGGSIEGNTSARFGAGFANTGTATLSDVRVAGNVTSSLSAARGGGVYNVGTLEIEDSTITANTAGGGRGGGIHNGGTLAVERTEISLNTGGTFGGGVYNDGASSDLVLIQSAVHNNSAATRGGGLANSAAEALITNSTFSANTATSATAIDAGSNGPVTVRSTTIIGGLSTTVHASNAVLTMQASIISAPLGLACSTSSLPTSLGSNVVSDTTCFFSAPGDVTEHPLLGALQDNGGPTPTHLPYESSPVVDAIPIGTAGCGVTLVVDQRNEPRPLGTACDIGAAEGSVALPPALSMTVNSATDGVDLDVGDAVCATATGVCTLRAAIQQANTWPSTDTITILAGVQPTLSIAGTDENAGATGDLDIRDHLVIHGNNSTVDANDLDRVFETRPVSLTIDRLTITDGTYPTGGGILNAGDLTLDRVTLSSNSSRDSGAGLSSSGTALLTNSVVISNHTTGTDEFGAGIENTGVLTVRDSFVWSNTSTSDAQGGGLYNSGTATAERTSFSSNEASQGGGILNTGSLTIDGGAISNSLHGGGLHNTGEATINNLTVTGNRSGHAVWNTGPTLNVSGSAIYWNYGAGFVNGSGASAGLANTTIGSNTGSSEIWNHGTLALRYSTVSADEGNAIDTAAPGTTSLEASAMEGKTGAACTGPGAVTSLGSNAASDSSCSLSGLGDVVADPRLGPIELNGGTTRTKLPFADSPLIDAIPPGLAGCGTTVALDQRGQARPGGGACDTGAAEGVGLLPTPRSFTVNTSTDAVDAFLGDGLCATAAGVCSLRAAVQQTNAWPTDDEITILPAFAPAIGGYGSGENWGRVGDYDITDTVIIHGNGVTINGGNFDNVFDIRNESATVEQLTVTNAGLSAIVIQTPATADLDHVSLTANASLYALLNYGTVTWTDGSAVANPTSVLGNQGIATLTRVRIAENTNSVNINTEVGALTAFDEVVFENNNASTLSNFRVVGSVVIRDSVISGNAADVNTGRTFAIESTGSLAIERSTVEGNTASRVIGAFGPATVDQSTFTGNIPTYDLMNTFSTIAVTGATIHGNLGSGTAIRTSGGFPAVLQQSIISHATGSCSGTADVASSYNVTADASCVFADPTNQQSVDPLLGPLADNGGPTKTMLLGVGSPAIDAVPAGTLGCGTTVTIDQRGSIRPVNGACDVGAVEVP